MVGEEGYSTSHAFDDAGPDSSTLGVGGLVGNIDANDQLLYEDRAEDSEADVHEPERCGSVTKCLFSRVTLIFIKCTYRYLLEEPMTDAHKRGASFEEPWLCASCSDQNAVIQESIVRDSSLWFMSYRSCSYQSAMGWDGLAGITYVFVQRFLVTQKHEVSQP